MENQISVDRVIPNTPGISDLVRVQVQGKYSTEHAWVRIATINDDKTFIGVAEKIDRYNDKYIIGDQYLFDYYPGMLIYNGQQLCYSDNVTICNCPGLCRDK
jgi:hypothetical protein